MINWENGNKAATKFTMFTHGLCVTLFLLVVSTTTFDANAQSQIQGSRDNTQVYSGVVYGPIDQNDTLWRIASRYKKDARFTVFQTMLAIFELNPQAFENGNFNTMVNGATLQLPSDRFIARIDPQRARAKAEADDRALGRASGDSSKQAIENSDSQSTSANIKPEIPLVNQDDLSKTSSQLQNQLNTLKNQQKQQFEQLKDQVAASITSVETLLQENKKLSDQLVKIDENNRNLTQKVETELQTQIDAQVDQLGQLIALVKDAEQRRIDEESQSIMQILSTPMALIIMMSSVTLLSILGLFIFLLRKPASVVQVEESTVVSADVPSDDLVIGEVDDVLDQDSEDLMAALSEDDEFEEDDILSDALEDDESLTSLSDEDIDAELDSLDDMLVPDSPADTNEIVEDDSFGEELDLGDDDFSLEDDAISLDEEDVDDKDESNTIDGINNDTSELVTEAENNDSNTDLELDKVESQIVKDELEGLDDLEDTDDAPKGISLDENGDIDENTIEQIGNQIEEKNQTITRMTDELLSELDNVPSDSTNIDEVVSGDEEEFAEDGPNALSSAIKANETDESSADFPESETDIPGDSAELVKVDLENNEKEITDTSSDSLLDGDTSDETATDKQDNDDIASHDELDELLSSLEDDHLTSNLDDDLFGNSDNNIDNEPVLSEVDSESLEDEQITDLADELLQELSNDDAQQDDDLGSLLDEIDGGEPEKLKSEDILNAIESDEYDEKADKTDLILDADDLLDDIPSFTSNISNDDIEDEIELDTEIAETKPKLEEALRENNITSTSKPSPANNTDDLLDLDEESDEEMLSGLSGLDNWLDEEDEAQLEEISENSKNDEFDLSALELDNDDLDSLSNAKSDEDDLIKNLNDSDFDDMLNDLSFDSKNDEASNISAPLLDNSNDKGKSERPPGNAGIDIDALMTPDVNALDDPATADEFDFVDVDDLLKESDAGSSLNDDDFELNLDGSLDKFMASESASSNSATTDSDVETNQSSNLDLAQVYIDMEDFTAAKELLEEVSRLGTQEQRDEATMLLSQLI